MRFSNFINHCTQRDLPERRPVKTFHKSSCWKKSDSLVRRRLTRTQSSSENFDASPELEVLRKTFCLLINLQESITMSVESHENEHKKSFFELNNEKFSKNIKKRWKDQLDSSVWFSVFAFNFCVESLCRF